MRRWLLTLASAFSLLLCLGTMGLWIQSYRAAALVATPSTYYAQAILARTWPPSHGPRIPLEGLIVLMQDITGSRIRVDWPALEAAHVGRQTQIALALPK